MTHATVTKGSGNVFRDLGFSEEKSAETLFPFTFHWNVGLMPPLVAVAVNSKADPCANI